MTVFQLMIFSCVRSTSPFDGELMQMSCSWEPASLYATKELCEVAGKSIIGNPIHSGIADGRKVEKTKCVPISFVDR